MRLVTYVCQTPFGPVERLGVLEGPEVIDLTGAYEAKLAADGDPTPAELAALLVPPSLLALLRREEAGMVAANTAALRASAPIGVHSMSRSVAVVASQMSVAAEMLSTTPCRCANAA